jgi:tyrosinase
MTVNLGPVSATLAEPEVVAGADGGAAYNPRCLKRDISSWVSSQWNKDEDSYTLITDNTDVGSFQLVLF